MVWKWLACMMRVFVHIKLILWGYSHKSNHHELCNGDAFKLHKKQMPEIVQGDILGLLNHIDPTNTSLLVVHSSFKFVNLPRGPNL